MMRVDKSGVTLYTFQTMHGDIGLLRNISFWCAFLAWFTAQFIKFVSASVRRRELDFRALVRLGGVPSSHSALVSALTVSVGLETGFGSPVFATTICFASIVMFDAQSVRRAAGLQARLLNQIVAELFKEHHLSEQKLVELLGHTPLEVLIGMAQGIFTALLIHAGWGF
jgi:acid phosphatase family membrane protein YuiD